MVLFWIDAGAVLPEVDDKRRVYLLPQFSVVNDTKPGFVEPYWAVRRVAPSAVDKEDTASVHWLAFGKFRWSAAGVMRLVPEGTGDEEAEDPALAASDLSSNAFTQEFKDGVVHVLINKTPVDSGKELVCLGPEPKSKKRLVGVKAKESVKKIQKVEESALG